MISDHSSEAENQKAEDFGSEFAVVSQVVSALQALDQDARVRLLRTVATFFKVDPSSLTLGRWTPTDSRYEALQVPSKSAVTSFSEDRAPSAKDFLRDKRPVTDVDKVACLAYYLTHYRGTPHFKTVDLSALNTEAAQIKFTNAAQAVDNATKKRLLASAGKGAKQLSADGELYVQALPDRRAAKDVLASARPRKKPRRGSGASASFSESPADK